MSAARVYAADAAVVFGSGLSVVPDGATVIDEVSYEDLGWPVTEVPGHPSRLRVCRMSGATLLLCCGRPHLYEGWPVAALRRAVDDLAAWGVTRLVLTNAAGGLGEIAPPGSALVVDEVVDLQRAPATEPDVLPATPPPLATAAEAALTPWLPVRCGRYVAVPGPQYETRAEARWLAGMGTVVGMSTAPELRAAADNGQQTCVVSLVVNRSGTDAVHADVLAAGLRLADGLRPGLAALLRACWPGVFADDCNDADRRQENQWT